MSQRPLYAILLCGLLAGACGDDAKTDGDTPDVVTTDNFINTDTDTATADTATADTATAEDTAPAVDTAVAQDTTAPPADTTPPDLGEGTCPGMLACAAACAGDAVCEAACATAADDASEATALAAVEACLALNGCSLPDGTQAGNRSAYQCQRQCLGQLSVCAAGGFGDTACPATNGCIVNGCFEGDVLCERGCLSGATQTAVEHLLDWTLCALSQCYDPNDIIAQEGCVQQVRNQAACSDPYTRCFGDVGAAPGAGAGGGE